MDYSKGKIYKIVNDIDDYVYVRSTIEILSSRMAKHRHRAIRQTDNKANLYQHMRKYGFNHFQIILIRNVPCDNKEELLKEERIEFELLQSANKLNERRPIISKDERNVLIKTYQKNNIDKVRASKRKYYHNNKDTERQRNKN